ncbi:uncharacterized protein LOC109601928 isoform X2 [Aethina tumida]|uniref:uncharacterized protein LOC109601928 isoform X2 n=1 Tax=Aethina tumida TaxID=116153 RepID=UPI002148F2E2|nr:uncharacterized protein LOC109601928 isoform X2 [Aethina tumida]
MNRKTYHWCVVPKCTNTSKTAPSKIFILVPSKPEMRLKWLELAGRNDAAEMSATSPIFFCEDHFDLPNDMENYMRYRLMGYVKKIKMRPGCMPSKFDCQHKTSLPSTSVSESVSNKRKKLQGGKNKRMKKSTSDKSEGRPHNFEADITSQNNQITDHYDTTNTMNTNANDNKINRTDNIQSNSNQCLKDIVNQKYQQIIQKSVQTPPKPLDIEKLRDEIFFDLLLPYVNDLDDWRKLEFKKQVLIMLGIYVNKDLSNIIEVMNPAATSSNQLQNKSEVQEHVKSTAVLSDGSKIKHPVEDEHSYASSSCSGCFNCLTSEVEIKKEPNEEASNSEIKEIKMELNEPILHSENDIKVESVEHCQISPNYLCQRLESKVDIKTEPKEEHNDLQSYYHSNLLHSEIDIKMDPNEGYS